MKKWLLFFLAVLFPVLSFASPVSVGPILPPSVTSIASGGAWQAVFPANTNRTALYIQNPCSATTQGIVTAESLFIAFGSKPPAVPSVALELTNCVIFSMDGNYVSQQPVWVLGVTTGHLFGAGQSQ